MSHRQMTGIEVAQQIMLTRPNIPAILCTGLVETIVEERARVTGIRSFLPKPLELHKTARVIREFLDSKQTERTSLEPQSIEACHIGSQEPKGGPIAEHSAVDPG